MASAGYREWVTWGRLVSGAVLDARPVAVVLAVLALAAAGCGDDDDSGDSSSGGGNPASGAPLEQAAAAMEKDDYDGAIKILEGLGNDPEAAKTLAKYKLIAAEETLQHAKQQVAAERAAGCGVAYAVVASVSPDPGGARLPPQGRACSRRLQGARPGRRLDEEGQHRERDRQARHRHRDAHRHEAAERHLDAQPAAAA